MLKAQPGEFLASGHANKKLGPHVRFAAGEGVDPHAAKRLQAYLDEPAFTILACLPPGSDGRWEPFIDELGRRGYDISSFRFSIFLRGMGPRVPRRPSVPQGKPGVLAARWGREVHDTTPDIMSFWGAPASSADSHLFQSLLSSHTANAEEFVRMSLHSFPTHPNMLERLRAFGFDQRTLRLHVRKTPGAPSDVDEDDDDD